MTLSPDSALNAHEGTVETEPSIEDQARLPAAELESLLLARLDDDKAQDVVSIDLTDKSSVADRMIVSDAEARLGTRYTIDTLRALMRRFPRVQFVWLMGSDNLAGFHRWGSWRQIARLVPIAVVPRPGHSVRSSPAARLLRVIRLHGPLNYASSTALRSRASVKGH